MHFEHIAVRGASENVPGEQGVWSSAPVEQNAPATHSMQSASLVIVIVVFMRKPAGHGSGAAAPAPQYEPAGQLRQVVAPAEGW